MKSKKRTCSIRGGGRNRPFKQIIEIPQEQKWLEDPRIAELAELAKRRYKRQ